MTRTNYGDRIRRTQNRAYGGYKDANEAHINGVDLRAAADARWAEKSKPRLQPHCIHDLFKLNIPERQILLAPIIPEKGLIMLYATRGVGKTHLAVGISLAVAAGAKYLKWAATKPRKVLHIDGEMPASELRQRFKQCMDGMGVSPEPGMLQVLSSDLIDTGIGNFASPKMQAELEPLLEDVGLLVLDNLSSLTTVIRDNDAESWNPIQEWLLRLRRRGISVLIVHHAGKGGQQRGTSHREDVLDTSISLRRPSDYIATEGARFEIHFEKARGIHGECVRPFEVKLEILNDRAIWTTREIDDVNLARVKALLEDELTVRDIADETGIPKSTVQRLKKKIEAEAAVKGTPWDKEL
jgi:putative DNA primase/helicase